MRDSLPTGRYTVSTASPSSLVRLPFLPRPALQKYRALRCCAQRSSDVDEKELCCGGFKRGAEDCDKPAVLQGRRQTMFNFLLQGKVGEMMAPVQSQEAQLLIAIQNRQEDKVRQE